MIKFFMGVFLFAAISILPFANSTQAFEFDDCADREGWIAHAWDDFNAKKFREASSTVDACLGDWIAQARFDQRRIKNGDSCPPTGAVSQTVASSIFANGVLNDVGTAQWIRARAGHLLNEIEGARRLYAECAEFQCARTWDPKGWFWAPGENCQARLDDLVN